MTRSRLVLLIVLVLVGISVGLVLRFIQPLFPDPPGHEMTLLAGEHGGNWQRTMSFLRGEHGLILKDGVIYNRDSHLDFHHFNPGGFRVGCQGGESGILRDLGSVDDLLPGQPAFDIFDEVRLRNGDLFLGGKAMRRSGPRSNHAPVAVGHCYFAVISRDKGHPDLDVAALILVLEHEPGKRVRVRWCLL